MQPTVLPYLHFTDKDGSPLNGEVSFGLPNQNPETAPITVYWDRAGTQPASQPITVKNGFAMRTGTPGTLFANQTYSLLVRNATGAMVFYGADSSQFDPSSANLTNTSQWVASGLSVVYNSASSFVVAGDQTADLHAGRRVRLTLGTGYVYGVITSSSFTSSTTVNVTLDGTSVLDASLSALDVSVLRADVEALPVLNYGKAQTVASAAGTTSLAGTWSNHITMTGTATITGFGTVPEGVRRTITAGGAFTLAYNATSMILPGASDITAASGDVFEVVSLGSGNWRCISYQRAAVAPLNIASDIGKIDDFATLEAPAGWLEANADAVSRTTYSKLFNAITRQTTGTTVSGSPTISSVANTTRVAVGMPISGPGIPSGATVAGVTASSITLSANATASASGVAIVIAPWGVGDGSTTFNLPDGRGNVRRGWDNGAGVDTGRRFGSLQLDAMQGHQHSAFNVSGGAVAGGGAIGTPGNSGSPVTDGINGTPRVASETRARNIAVLTCVKYA